MSALMMMALMIGKITLSQSYLKRKVLFRSHASYQPYAMSLLTDSLGEISNKHKIAVLIDGDNAESNLISEIISEAGRFGRVTVRRIYADWTSPQMYVQSIRLPP